MKLALSLTTPDFGNSKQASAVSVSVSSASRDKAHFPHSLRPDDAMCVLKRSTKHCELFTHTNGMGREVGAGLRMGNTCTPMADSCQYIAKPLEYCKVISLQLNFKKKVKSLSCVRLFATPWTRVHQAPPSMGFSRQEYWSWMPLYLSREKRKSSFLLCL